MTAPPHRFDPGRVCLDLLGCERPLDEAGLAAWLITAGLVPPGTRLGSLDARWAARFAELRSAVDRLVRTELAGRTDPAALANVNALAQAAPPALCAVRTEDGLLVRELTAAPDCDALLAAVARDAVDLLTDPDARAGLRQCEGGHCRRIYLDTSRGRRRRWCSSERCGNRERVARHRRRAALAHP
ncbi:CGNR zinc finger domain-containing protein [Streptomyces sp. NPDC060194]|uniref:CGNR zinc finger domain-containing protein n=1 Tax=Streptomyces sp. NPDC060194 TaxID=3347069 RepID=UPI003659D51D